MKKNKLNKNDGKTARIENFQNQIKELQYRSEMLKTSLLRSNKEISELESDLKSINDRIANKKKIIEMTINDIEGLVKKCGSIDLEIKMIEREKSRMILVINQNKSDEETIQEELRNEK